MMKSLYAGVSGLKVHNQRMDVIGNNIANVNTTAFKASTVTFRDVFYQTKQYASEGSNIIGGVNPRQIGYGAKLGSINQVMTQSGFNYSDSVYDCALQGSGFFQVMDQSGNVYYTRNGLFNIDNYGNLTDSNGYVVLGVAGNSNGVAPSSQRVQITIPSVDNSRGSMYKEIDGYGVTISVPGYGPNGNISVTFQNSPTPFATLTGKSLNVQLDLTRNFANQAEFNEAVNSAIQAGGVNLPDGVLPLRIDFANPPPQTDAISGSNYMEFLDPDGSEIGRLVFDMMQAGEFSNAYEIDIVTSATTTVPTARWSDNLLTVTIPSSVISDDPSDPNYNVPKYPFTLKQVQDALNQSAGLVKVDDGGGNLVWTEGPNFNVNKLVRVSQINFDAGVGDGWQTPPTFYEIDPVTHTYYSESDTEFQGADDLAGWNFVTSLGENNKRMGMQGGEDNFYSRMAKNLATVQLGNGRYASEQTVSDLTKIFIDVDGTIYGQHPVHGELNLGRIDVVTFQNEAGLNQVGTSYWQPSMDSGEPEVKFAAENGSPAVISGALEMSNTDIAQEFSDMIITQRGFQANSRIITVSDTMLEELINLKR